MIFSVRYFDNEILIDKDIINVIEIENKKCFYRFINDMHKCCNALECDDFKMFDAVKREINLNNKFKIIINYFDFEDYTKKYQQDISKFVLNNIESEDVDLLIKNYNKLISSYNKILTNLDIPFFSDNNISINTIIKNIKINIDYKDDLLSNLLLIIDLEKVLNNQKILVFINLKQLLSNEELIELYKYSIYNSVNIILIDSQSYGTKLNYEKKLIIDDFLEEFML